MRYPNERIRPMTADHTLTLSGVGRRALLFITPALMALLAWQRRWITDDGFIDLRIVEHLLRGDGPLFNTGERVEAYTNPLWVAFLGLWGLVGGQLETGAVVLGLVFGVAGIALAQAAATHVWQRTERSAHIVFLPLGRWYLSPFLQSGISRHRVWRWAWPSVGLDSVVGYWHA